MGREWERVNNEKMFEGKKLKIIKIGQLYKIIFTIFSNLTWFLGLFFFILIIGNALIYFFFYFILYVLFMLK